MRNKGLRILKWLGIFGIYIVFLASGVFWFWSALPYQTPVRDALRTWIEAQGYGPVSFEVERLTANGTALTDVSYTSGEATLSVPQVSADYDLIELIAPTFPISFHAPGLTLRHEKVTANTGKITSDMAYDRHASAWSGPFRVEDITMAGLPSPVPALSITGNMRFRDTLLDIEGTLQSKDNTTATVFHIFNTAEAPTETQFSLKNTTFPWGGGTVTIPSVQASLPLNTAVDVSLKLKKIRVKSLLDTITDGKVDGTGTLSGTLPVTWHPDGNLTLKDGLVRTTSTGTLSVSADALPATGREDMETVRAALQDFRYTSMDVFLSSDAQQKSAIRLEVKGNNPQAFGGRPIHLNVTLTGDVLPLLQQSILPISDIRKLLKHRETQ